MKALNKQALREAAEKATAGQWVVELGDEVYAVDGDDSEQIAMVFSDNGRSDAAFIAAASPVAVLSLLDENLQLQLDKDSLEAVAIAMRDDMRDTREKLGATEKLNAELNQRNTELTAKIEPMDRRIAELERSETQLINERDDAESALNDAYAVMGQAPEWSNWFGFADAIDEIELACRLWRNQTDDVIQLRQHIQELEARTVVVKKFDDFQIVHYGGSEGYAKGYIDCQNNYNKALTAAGIGVKGE